MNRVQSVIDFILNRNNARNDFKLAKIEAQREDLKRIEYIRKMLPVSTRAEEEIIVIDGHICEQQIVLGTLKGLSSGFPDILRRDFLESICTVNNPKAVVKYHVCATKNRMDQAVKETDESLSNLNFTLHKETVDNPSLMNIGASEDINNLVAQAKRLHRGQPQFSASIILSIRACCDTKEESLELIKSVRIIINQKLSDFDVNGKPPIMKTMEAYRTTMNIPVRSTRMEVEIFPNYLALLMPFAAATVGNTDDGYPTAIDRRTGQTIYDDPKKNYHSTYTGPNGSGKTISLLKDLANELDILNRKMVVVTPKYEASLVNVAKAYGQDRATYIKIGPSSEYNINPLQIIQYGETNEYTYANHVRVLLLTLNTLFKGSEESRDKDGQIVQSLEELYISRGIYPDDPNTWKDADWPLLTDLNLLWIERAEKDPSNLTKRALAGKLTQAPLLWKYLSRKTNVDLSKDILLFDLSDITSDISEALFTYITCMLVTIFKNSKNTGGVNIAADEVGVLFRNELVRDFLVDVLRMGRSGDVHLKICAQSPIDYTVNPTVDAMIRANVSKHKMFGKLLQKHNVPHFQKYYSLTDEQVKSWLIGSQAGEGIMILNNIIVPFKTVLTKWESDLLIVDEMNKPIIQKTASIPEFSLLNAVYNNLVEEHGVVFNSWINASQKTMNELGFIAKTVPHWIGGGQHKVYVRKSLVNENWMISNQGIEHKTGAIEVASVLLAAGFPAKIDDFKDVDVSTNINGKRIAFEIEVSHKKAADLNTKKSNAQQNHDIVYFIVTGDNIDDVAKAIGSENVIPRGGRFAEILQELIKVR
jgi:hypothetical protein